MDCMVHGVAELDMTEWLFDFQENLQKAQENRGPRGGELKWAMTRVMVDSDRRASEHAAGDTPWVAKSCDAGAKESDLLPAQSSALQGVTSTCLK